MKNYLLVNKESETKRALNDKWEVETRRLLYKGGNFIKIEWHMPSSRFYHQIKRQLVQK